MIRKPTACHALPCVAPRSLSCPCSGRRRAGWRRFTFFPDLGLMPTPARKQRSVESPENPSICARNCIGHMQLATVCKMHGRRNCGFWNWIGLQTKKVSSCSPLFYMVMLLFGSQQQGMLLGEFCFLCSLRLKALCCLPGACPDCTGDRRSLSMAAAHRHEFELGVHSMRGAPLQKLMLSTTARCRAACAAIARTRQDGRVHAGCMLCPQAMVTRASGATLRCRQLSSTAESRRSSVPTSR